MQLDSEPNNAEQLNIDLHDWDFGPASPIYDGLQSASGDAISDIPRPFYSRTTLVPSHPDHPRYGTLQGDNESEYDSSDESMVQRNGFYPHGIEKGCGFPLQHVPTLAEQELRSFIRNPDPYHPFKSEKELNFATWLVESGLPIKQIDALLKGNMPLDPSLPRCFKSWYLLKKQLDEFDSGLGMSSWHAGECNTTWSEDSDEIVKFYYRDIKEVAKWLLRQPYHEAHMAYTAGHRIRDGMRCYDEMWTGDWWIDVQVNI